MKIHIKQASESDAFEILEIYSPYVMETAITFECVVPTLDDFRKRIHEITNEYPYFVCLINGKIVGYAYAHRQMERAAYRWNAELSVYVSKAYLRRGIGKALYFAVIEILKLQNIQNVYGGVTLPNTNSIKLHEYFGFKTLGIYHQTGYKCGAWHDVMWLEKYIGKHENNPPPFVSIKQIEAVSIEKIMNRCCGMIRMTEKN